VIHISWSILSPCYSLPCMMCKRIIRLYLNEAGVDNAYFRWEPFATVWSVRILSTFLKAKAIMVYSSWRIVHVQILCSAFLWKIGEIVVLCPSYACKAFIFTKQFQVRLLYFRLSQPYPTIPRSSFQIYFTTTWWWRGDVFHDCPCILGLYYYRVPSYSLAETSFGNL